MKKLRASFIFGLLTIIIALILTGCAQKDLVTLAKLVPGDLSVSDKYGNTVKILDGEEFLAVMKAAKPADAGAAKSEAHADYVFSSNGQKVYYDQDGKFLIFVGANRKKVAFKADLDSLIENLGGLAPSSSQGIDLVSELSPLFSRISKVKEPSAAKYDLGDKTLLMVAAGERPTGGYTMEVDDMALGTDGSLVVTVRLNEPKEAADQAFSHPYLEIMLDEKDPDVEVRLISAGEKLEHVNLASVKAGQNVILFKPERGALLTERVTMFGFARIFEGNFNVEVEDGHYILGTKNVQTEGAPEWGYFEFTMDLRQASGPHGMVIVSSVSAKDGSKIEELIVPVAFGGK